MPRHYSNAPKSKPKIKNWKGTVKRIWTYLSKEKGLLSLVILMVFISSFLGLLGPFLVGMAIDDFIVTRDAGGLFELILWLAVVYEIGRASCRERVSTSV